MNEQMDLGDIAPTVVDVMIGGKRYSLREASGDAAIRYRNRNLENTTFGPNGKPQTIRNLADVEAYLVSLCLFDDEGKPVSEKQIRAWPARIQKSLFDKVQAISGMSESAQVERGLLIRALSLEGAPLTTDALRTWVDGLADSFDPEFNTLSEWLKPSPEEQAKN